MKKALKNFGLGLVYFFLLPAFLCMVALAGVCALFVIIVAGCKGLIRFFKGEKFFAELPEDARVREIKEYQASLQTAPSQPQPQVQPDNRVFIQQNYYPNGQQTQNAPQENKPSQEPLPQTQIQQKEDSTHFHEVHFFDNSIPEQSNNPEEIPHSDKPVEIDMDLPHQIIDISGNDNGGNDL